MNFDKKSEDLKVDYLLTWSEESVGAVKEEEEEIANGRSLGA